MIAAVLISMALMTAWLVALWLGARLIWRGWRGETIESHPFCARCTYDLFGLDRRSANCPECGSDLDQPGATMLGRIGPQWRRVATGVLIIVGSFALLAGGLFESARPRESAQPQQVVITPAPFRPGMSPYLAPPRLRAPRPPLSTSDEDEPDTEINIVEGTGTPERLLDLLDGVLPPAPTLLMPEPRREPPGAAAVPPAPPEPAVPAEVADSSPLLLWEPPRTHTRPGVPRPLIGTDDLVDFSIPLSTSGWMIAPTPWLTRSLPPAARDRGLMMIDPTNSDPASALLLPHANTPPLRFRPPVQRFAPGPIGP